MMTPGTRVQFPAKQGDRDIAVTGTIVESPRVLAAGMWRHVLLDNGKVVEAHLSTLTLTPAPERVTVVRGEVCTGKFTFVGYGRTRNEVEGELLNAYTRHAIQNPYACPDLIVEALEDDEVSWSQFVLPCALRDGEPV